jgi:hypothetical protein
MSLIPTPEFDESLLTTRTLLFQFTGTVDLDLLARTLPTVPIHFDKPWKRGTKPKIKQFPPFGKIYAVRYGGISRGVYGPAFKNSVMVDFSVGTKSVNVKISKKSIHICGIRMATEGLELSQLIMAYAQRAHTFLEELKAHSSPGSVLNYIDESTRGSIVPLPKYVLRTEMYKDKPKVRRYEEGTEERVGALPLDVEACVASTGASKELVIWITDLLVGLTAHSDVVAVTDWMRSVCADERSLLGPDGLVLDTSPHHVMINCSYSLGFPINKEVLKALCDQRNDFIAHYNNAVDFYVNVVLKCSEQDLAERRVLVSKKKKMAFHTFIVYDSGHVMQSSKVYESMKDAFYRFRAMINEMRPLIEDTEATQARLVAAHSTKHKPVVA